MIAISVCEKMNNDYARENNNKRKWEREKTHETVSAKERETGKAKESEVRLADVSGHSGETVQGQ